MFKIITIVSLMLIGSTLWAASLSCDSCGSECASACGTRHFRSCCFNYLRKKRGSDYNKLLMNNPRNSKPEPSTLQDRSPKMPFYVLEMPEHIYNIVPNEFKPFPFDDTVDNRVQVYDV